MSRPGPSSLWLPLLAALVTPLLLASLGLRRLRRRRELAAIWPRLIGSAPQRPDQPILLHGVSLGEVNLLRPVAEALRTEGLPILVSSSTASGESALRQHYRAGERCLLPFDLPWAVDRFLARCQPRALLLFELELWPSLLAACRRRGIPVVILNGRLSERSLAGYCRWRLLTGSSFRSLSLVSAQNPTWAARFRALGAPRVRVGGSLKADMVRPATAAEATALAAQLQLPGGALILLGASTGAGEEALILAAWRQLRPAGWLLVLCPRHPERAAAVAADCRQHGQEVWLSSQGGEPAAAAIRIVDAFGQLPALYALAEIAIVGGSWGSGRGGQNMLEAAAAGCCTIVGPDNRNQVDGLAALRRHNAVVEAQPAELAARLAELIAAPAARSAFAAAAQQAWQQACGALPRVLRQLRPVIHRRGRRA